MPEFERMLVTQAEFEWNLSPRHTLIGFTSDPAERGPSQSLILELGGRSRGSLRWDLGGMVCVFPAAAFGLGWGKQLENPLLLFFFCSF